MVKEHSAKEETGFRHYMGYSFPAARDLLYAPTHIQDSRPTYYGRGALAGMRNKEGKKEVFYLMTHSFTVIWPRTYGKGPFR